jgi:phenylalanyl-tRNA synthetase beta chain
VGIFELAKIYSYKQNLPKEEDVLGILVWGNFYSDWLRNQRFNFSLFDLKGIIETILRDLGIENFQFKKSQIPYLVEGVIFGLKDKDFGFFGEVNKNVSEKFKIKTKFGVYFAQIYLEDLESLVHLEKKFRPLPIFPSMRRDISLVVKRNITCEEILKVIHQAAGELLSSVTLFDRYTGEPIPQDSIGLSFSLEYRSKEKTLTAEEVNSLHKIVLEDLEKKLDARIRGSFAK